MDLQVVERRSGLSGVRGSTLRVKEAQGGHPRLIRLRSKSESTPSATSKATDRSVPSTVALASLCSADSRGGSLYMGCGTACRRQVPRASSVHDKVWGAECVRRHSQNCQVF